MMSSPTSMKKKRRRARVARRKRRKRKRRKRKKRKKKKKKRRRKKRKRRKKKRRNKLLNFALSYSKFFSTSSIFSSKQARHTHVPSIQQLIIHGHTDPSTRARVRDNTHKISINVVRGCSLSYATHYNSTNSVIYSC